MTWCQVMRIKDFFESHPVFRYEEFAEFMASNGSHRQQSWKQQLSYHKKVGHLILIRKFLYAVKPFGTQDIWIDPYLIASKATDDAIIAYHASLELHGSAYTTFNELAYLTSHRVLPFSYESQYYRAINQPTALIKANQTNYGIDLIKRNGILIKVTNLERTIVDILDRPDLGGGWEEIWRSLDNITQFDPAKIVNYALLLKNATTVAKVGYFLEQRPKHYVVEKKYIDMLLPHIPKGPHYMDRTRYKKGTYLDKWRLVVPLEIINRTWEEPNDETI